MQYMFYLSIYLYIYLSIYLSIYLCIPLVFYKIICRAVVFHSYNCPIYEKKNIVRIRKKIHQHWFFSHWLFSIKRIYLLTKLFSSYVCMLKKISNLKNLNYCIFSPSLIKIKLALPMKPHLLILKKIVPYRHLKNKNV